MTQGWDHVDLNALKRSVTLSHVVGNDIVLTKNGPEFDACCPFHNERTPSFTVNDKKGFWHCFGCGAHGDVFDWLERWRRMSKAEAINQVKEWNGHVPPTNDRPRSTVAEYEPQTGDWKPILPVPADAPDLFEADRKRTTPIFNPKRAGTDKQMTVLRPSAAYRYFDAAGALLGYVLRCDFPDGGKFTPTVTFCEGPEGKRQWCLISFPEPRPLYGLDQLAANPAANVVVVEGEKAKVAGQKLLPGVVVVTWPGGSKGIRYADWSVLKGRKVVGWPDADYPGFQAMEGWIDDGDRERDGLAQMLIAVGVAGFKLVDPPDDVEEGWDAADALAEGWDTDRTMAFLKARMRDHAGRLPKLDGQPAPDHAEPIRAPADEPDQDPEAAPLILDPRQPYLAADEFIRRRYVQQGTRTLLFHQGEFLAWDGTAYAAVDQQTMRSKVYEFQDGARRLTKDEPAPFQPNSKTVSEVVDAVKARANVPADVSPPAWLGSPTGPFLPAELLVTPGRILHLPTHTSHPCTPRLFTTTALPVPYASGATHAQWSAFLDSILADDQQAKTALQEFFGYLLTPETHQQKVLLIVGPPRCGKGVLARVLTGLLGRSNVTAPTLAGLAGNFGLAPLIGKLAAIIADARIGGRADQHVITERILSISGEDYVSIDRKYLPAWTGRLPTRFVILTNELPRLADASGALASRFIVIQIKKSFLGHEDPGLTDRLLGELPGILNWAIDGWERLQERGYFVQPASAADAIDELEALGSPVGAFVKDRCVVAPGRQIDVGTLFRAWSDWCHDNGRKDAGTAVGFGRDLRAAVMGITVKQRRADGGRERYYEGIGLAP